MAFAVALVAARSTATSRPARPPIPRTSRPRRSPPRLGPRSLLAGLLSLTVWAGVSDYALRVTSDTPTFIALVTGMAERPFQEQSPFLAQQVATQHATPYIQAVAFLWSFLGGGERDPVTAGRLLALVGIPVFALLLYSVFLYARRLAGSRAAWLSLPVLLGIFGPPHVIWASDQSLHGALYASYFPQNLAIAMLLLTLLALERDGYPIARSRVPRCGDDDARAPVLGRPALRARNGPGLLHGAPRGTRLLPGARCVDCRLRARDDLAGVLARRVRSPRRACAECSSSASVQPPSSPSMVWHASSDRPGSACSHADCSNDFPRAVPRSSSPSSALSGRRSSSSGSWRSSTRRRGSRHASRSTGWTIVGAGRSSSSRGRSAYRGSHGSLGSGSHRPRRLVRGLPWRSGCWEPSASRFRSGTGSSSLPDPARDRRCGRARQRSEHANARDRARDVLAGDRRQGGDALRGSADA